ncbi:MAG: hypothetical protein ACE37F_27450 [Nannocystaceae bacterium]|nr:hypothetical protein [bacterium]
MQRLFATLLASSLLLGASACEGEAPKPEQAAKKDDAKADAAKSEDAKADAPKDDAPKDDAPKDDAPKDDAPGGEAPPADADDAKVDDAKGEGEADDLEGYDPRVAKAARVAEKISADPQKADDVLATLDLDRDALDELMYEIASDPGLTAQYRMARGI